MEALDCAEADRAQESMRLASVRALPYVQDRRRRETIDAWQSLTERRGIFEESEESKQARQDAETIRFLEGLRGRLTGRRG